MASEILTLKAENIKLTALHRDAKYVLEHEKDWSLDKVVDCRHVPHQEMVYDYFIENDSYIPIIERDFFNNSTSNDELPKILLFDLKHSLKNPPNFDSIKNVVAIRIDLKESNIGNGQIAQFLQCLSLSQIVLTSANKPEFLKQPPNAQQVFNDMDETVKFLAELKALKPEQIVLITTDNACRIMPKLKTFLEKTLTSVDEDYLSEAESETLSILEGITQHSEAAESENSAWANCSKEDSNEEKFDYALMNKLLNALEKSQNENVQLRSMCQKAQEYPSINEDLFKILSKASQYDSFQPPTRREMTPKPKPATKKKPKRDGPFLDSKGRWRNSNGQFIKTPANPKDIPDAKLTYSFGKQKKPKSGSVVLAGPQKNESQRSNASSKPVDATTKSTPTKTITSNSKIQPSDGYCYKVDKRNVGHYRDLSTGKFVKPEVAILESTKNETQLTPNMVKEPISVPKVTNKEVCNGIRQEFDKNNVERFRNMTTGQFVSRSQAIFSNPAPSYSYNPSPSYVMVEALAYVLVILILSIVVVWNIIEILLMVVLLLSPMHLVGKTIIKCC
uniref:Uncharacterized protein n=1 Tax=Acrobeloides nanus TaxID=290746 RepID=A0A914CFQ4_9BILA